MEFGQQNFNAGYGEKGNRKYGANERSNKDGYSKEFERKSLKADTEEEYTEKMWEEDKKYLDEWLEYERKKSEWLKEKLEEEKKVRTEIAGSDFEERKRILDWFGNSSNGLYDQWSDKMNKIFDEKSRINEVYFNKKFNIYGNKNEEKIKSEFENLYDNLYRKVEYQNFSDIKNKSYADKAKTFILLLESLKNGSLGFTAWQAKLEMLKDFQRRIDIFLREVEEERRRQESGGANGEKGAGGSSEKSQEKICQKCGKANGINANFCGYCGNLLGKSREQEETGKKENADDIACRELGITKNEHEFITRGATNFSNAELIRLTLKVLGASDESKIKDSYRKCAMEWHPDTKNTRYGIGVSETKFKIAKNLYEEYKKRFEKK